VALTCRVAAAGGACVFIPDAPDTNRIAFPTRWEWQSAGFGVVVILLMQLAMLHMTTDTKTPQTGRTSLQLHQEELEELERLLDGLSRCSRHRLLLACVRQGLRAFRNDPALVAEGLRDLGVRLRTPTT
jgi:hypothetical protein